MITPDQVPSLTSKIAFLLSENKRAFGKGNPKDPTWLPFLTYLISASLAVRQFFQNDEKAVPILKSANLKRFFKHAEQDVRKSALDLSAVLIDVHERYRDPAIYMSDAKGTWKKNVAERFKSWQRCPVPSSLEVQEASRFATPSLPHTNPVQGTPQTAPQVTVEAAPQVTLQTGVRPPAEKSSEAITRMKRHESVVSLHRAIATVKDRIADAERVPNDDAWLPSLATSVYDLASVFSALHSSNSHSSQFQQLQSRILGQFAIVMNFHVALMRTKHCNKPAKDKKSQMLLFAKKAVDVACPKLLVGIAGQGKAGKTSFINAFCGYEVLPSSNFPFTVSSRIVSHDPSERVPVLVLGPFSTLLNKMVTVVTKALRFEKDRPAGNVQELYDRMMNGNATASSTVSTGRPDIDGMIERLLRDDASLMFQPEYRFTELRVAESTIRLVLHDLNVFLRVWHRSFIFMNGLKHRYPDAVDVPSMVIELSRCRAIPEVRVCFERLDTVSMDGGFSLVDTPGLDEAEFPGLAEMCDAMCDQMHAMLLATDRPSSDEFRRFHTTVMEKPYGQNSMIVVTKADLFTDATSEDFERTTMAQFQKSRGGVVAVSSKFATSSTVFRRWRELNGHVPTANEAREDLLLQSHAMLCLGSSQALMD